MAAAAGARPAAAAPTVDLKGFQRLQARARGDIHSRMLSYAYPNTPRCADPCGCSERGFRRRPARGAKRPARRVRARATSRIVGCIGNYICEWGISRDAERPARRLRAVYDMAIPYGPILAYANRYSSCDLPCRFPAAAVGVIIGRRLQVLGYDAPLCAQALQVRAHGDVPFCDVIGCE